MSSCRTLLRSRGIVQRTCLSPGRISQSYQRLLSRNTLFAQRPPALTAYRLLTVDSSRHTRLPGSTAQDTIPESRGQVYIALGSNVGDRLKNIEDACRALNAEDGIRILQTSMLYETAPMYVTDQESFLNATCEIETHLEPMELLNVLQGIEQRLGRVKLVDKGPRNIDLDILLFRRERISNDRLTIPHPLMHEREFVLRPLCDLGPSVRAMIVGSETVSSLRHRIMQEDRSAFRVTPLAPGLPMIKHSDTTRSTLIMSILNTTPDSFSDGGDHEPTDPDSLKSIVRKHVSEGAAIIDIGGQSSRPNAPDVTADNEIARILPAIKAIKSAPTTANVAISIDTYRAAVAEAAVNAGANIINDISGGQLDPDMLTTVAKLGCTYIIMHMRGTPSTMSSTENTTYLNDHTSVDAGLVSTIAKELRQRLYAAQKAGIYRWRIVLDPGIGFAKTAEQNLQILANLQSLKQHKKVRGYPWLVGTSRKTFIGKFTGVEHPKDRLMGTAATVTAAVRGGADIVRVHDVKEMVEVAKMADAIFRR